MDRTYDKPEPTREEVDATSGPLLLEFGADWCPHCQAVQPILEAAHREFPGVTHRKVADGKGKPLGRSFQVKLWPNLVFLKDGKVVAQMARPSAEEVRQGFQALSVG